MHPPPGFEEKKYHTRNVCKTNASSCRNCGQHGHIYKDCPHPITSFGIICFRTNASGNVDYLMIQRKDSLSFMEFIRGKYDLLQVDYISQLLAGMTVDERTMLMTKPFEVLWNHVWYQPSIPKHTSEFDHAKKKFDTLREGYIHDTVGLIQLSNLLETHPSPFQDPEWGFPKGRRKIREEDVDCAVREFCEETGFQSKDIRLISDIPPFEEIFFGTNNVLYRHIYYVARVVGDSEKHLHVDPSNLNQAREVRALQWFSANDVITHIRPHNRERKQLFEQAHCKVVAMLLKHKSIHSK